MVGQIGLIHLSFCSTNIKLGIFWIESEGQNVFILKFDQYPFSFMSETRV